MSRRQTCCPSSFTLAALPRAQGGTSRVQRARRPPAQRRQLAEAAASRAAIGHEAGAGGSVNCQINSREEKKGIGKKKPQQGKIYVERLGSFSGGVSLSDLQFCAENHPLYWWRDPEVCGGCDQRLFLENIRLHVLV